MGRRLNTIIFLVIVALLLSSGQILADSHKTVELNRQISEISLVRKDITQKISQATDMRGQLQEQMQQLIKRVVFYRNRL